MKSVALAATVAVCLAGAAHAGPWTPLAGLDVGLMPGDGVCPAGSVAVSPTLASRIEAFTDHGLCGLVGERGIVRLADGGTLAGAAYGCAVQPRHPQHTVQLTETLCVQFERRTLKVPRELYPGAGGKVLTFLAEALDAQATDLATVYISFKSTESGWPAARMIWDAPPGGGPVWVPDGKKLFQLRRVGEVDQSAPPKLSGAQRVFENHDPAPWTMAKEPVAPDLVIAELNNVGLSVLPDGTLRFYAGSVPTNRGKAVMDTNTRPATFVPNDKSKGVILKDPWYVDDRPTTAVMP